MSKDKNTWQPIEIVSSQLKAFIEQHPGIFVVDEIRRNIEEIFLLRNPKYRFDKNYKDEFEKFFDSYRSENFGNWFYFSWINSLVRYLPEGLHYELRTGRNKQLITAEEQARFYNANIAFLGMSVGSHVAVVTAMTSGAKHIKLADPDVFSGDNLNRVRTGFQNVGTNKAVVVARQIFEINPYAEIELYTDGLTGENAENILGNTDLIVEEMDSPYWKLKIRELARDRGIPVLMGTDNGDSVIVDIERYDINKKLPILNGCIGKMTAEQLKSMSPKDLPKVAGKIAGADLTVPKMLNSVAEVGKSLYSWPQLGTAANMCGSVISMLARRILVGDKNIESGRYSVNTDAIFESDYKRKWLSRKIEFIKFIKKMMSNT
ncbi:MAG: UBA/THIF-type NAD/FAD binding protein [Parcubacteria group bacterium GW2011_GWC1_38_6]|nr:MAG: UBA/THIF-type NAD/FAD binding protein [Parcubacteria group bacterium GW2011_GWA1_36_12]KKQ77502.1 MAG: UBA/THIF-type NAD/FAD binding protein [Parcubacteria group bacterium GW2011_GWC1_38_6]